MAHFHQLLSHPWQIFTSDDLDAVVEDDELSEITKSKSETKPSKSEISRLRNLIQMIKVSSLHQLITGPWKIVAAAGLGPGR